MTSVTVIKSKLNNFNLRFVRINIKHVFFMFNMLYNETVKGMWHTTTYAMQQLI